NDGVHANDHQRKRPGPPATNIRHCVEAGSEQKAPAATEEGPTGRPNAFDDRAKSKPAQNTACRQTDEASDDEPADFGPGLALTPQDAAGDQAEDHRAQRRDKAKGGIATTIEVERVLARKQIHKPVVE